MKKVLIITYYWPPSGGAGVQRWLKFAKYLPQFGWEPVIYTPENPEYPSEDRSFEKDIPAYIQIIRKPIWEPYNIYRNLTGKKNERINAGFISESKKQSWKDKLSIWIRGNFLIPDPRRFWIKPSVRFLTKFLNENMIDTIITTGPPHSMHLIGLGIKKRIPEIKWIADFRDPWTKIDFYKELHLNPVSDMIHHALERKVVKMADAVVVVSGGMCDEFKLLHPKRLELITNGYDASDTETEMAEPDSFFSLSHIGTLNAARNPKTLWKVLSELCSENPEFKSDLKIKLIGKTDFSVLEDIKTKQLTRNLIKIDYVTHNEAIKLQLSSQILLLLINNTENAKSILTGKFFEYLGSKRPILAIGPTDGDVANVLKNTKSGQIADFNDEIQTRKIIMEFYSKYKKGILQVDSEGVELYSRKKLTNSLVEVINNL